MNDIPSPAPQAIPTVCLHSGRCKDHPCTCPCRICLVRCLDALEADLERFLSGYIRDKAVIRATLDWAVNTGLEWIGDGRAEEMGVFRAFHLARAALRFGYAMCRNEVTGWTPWAIVAPVDPDPEQTRRGADPVLTDAWTMMESMLRFLTPRQSEVLRLCHFEGLSQAEVARRLKLTRATVWKHLKAAEATMREPWGDCEPFWL